MAAKARLYFNSVVSVGGESGAALVNLATLALLARWLGPEDFGQIALAMTYALSFDLLLNFQSWRLVIRYGAAAMERNDRLELSRILKLSAILDVGSAVLATFASVALAGFIVPWVSGGDVLLFKVYSATILFNVVGHSTGLLRLFEKFTFLSAHRFATALARLSAVFALHWFGQLSLTNAVVGLVGAECAMKVVLLVGGLLEARRQGLSDFARASLQGVTRIYDDLVSFAMYSNLNDTVLKVVQQIDVLMVAYFMAPADAGAFRLIKSLGSVVAMVAGPVGQVIYPEIAKIYATDPDRLPGFLAKLWRTLGLVIAFGFIAYVLVGEFVVEAVFGTGYLLIFQPSVVYMLGAALSVLCLPFTPVLLVQGRQRLLFVAYFFASAVYIVAVCLGAGHLGLVGAAAAFPLLYMSYLLVVGRIGLGKEQ